MKSLISYLIFISLSITLGMMAVAADKTLLPKEKKKMPATSEKKTRVYPIAAGVWYPGDGPLPEKPMRYYRVRCWPGCHSGSSLGMYPNRRLKGKPIFPTSTIDMHAAIKGGKK